MPNQDDLKSDEQPQVEPDSQAPPQPSVTHRSKQALKTEVERQALRIKKADEERPSLLAQTSYLGVLGVLLVLPIVGGAYLGQWLDEQQSIEYSMSWTISFILLGVFIGALNVFLYVRKT